WPERVSRAPQRARTAAQRPGSKCYTRRLSTAPGLLQGARTACRRPPERRGGQTMTATQTPTYRTILFEQEEAIAHVTMNRPERRNALSLEHMQELIACFKGIG